MLGIHKDMNLAELAHSPAYHHGIHKIDVVAYGNSPVFQLLAVLFQHIASFDAQAHRNFHIWNGEAVEHNGAQKLVETVPKAVFVVWIVLVELVAALAAIFDFNLHHSLEGRVRINSVSYFHNARR